MKRREMLGAGLAAATLGAGFNMESFAAPKKTRIGLILYTLRDFLGSEDEIARTLERVKEIGYDAVEVTSVGQIDNSRLAELLKQNELQAVSAHAGWNAVRDDPQRVIDQYTELGCTHIALGSIPGEYRNTEGYKEFARMASDAAARLAEGGISWGYHNHSFEFAHFDGMTGQELMRLYSIPRYFLFQIDTYWVQHGGADPAQWIRKVKGRCRTVHMKDIFIHDGGHMFAEVGEGNLNWPAILDACDYAGVEYLIVEQDRCLRDPFESIAISLKNMKSWGLS